MSIVKQLFIVVSIYTVFVLLIEGVLWLFNPELNDYLRGAVTSLPILISIIVTRIVIKRIEIKRNVS